MGSRFSLDVTVAEGAGRRASRQPRAGPAGDMSRGDPRPGRGTAGPGCNVRKFLVPRSDTPLCLEVIGDFWNELLFKELFFLKTGKTKILADY